MTKKVPLTLMFLVCILGISFQSISQIKTNNMKESTKEIIGLLVTMKAQSGKEQAVKDFLLGGLSLVNQEPLTQSWYAFQINENTFGIYDTFEAEEGRQAHLSGEVAKALLANAGDLLVDFDVNVHIQAVDLTASEFKKGQENKGLLVIMKANAGKSADVESFLLAGQQLVKNEPETVSWYAFQIAEDTYAIFDTFADDKGRDAHLNGKVAEALMQNAPLILEGFEASSIQMIDILASK
ncbi:putative quinol monooxygenase [Aquimarina sp. 2304DJ70-9]|uniref:putative quinol monooxygenase n=1 Tax=Aquimarina penaris TaxID=3231044 RepID=UPI00346266A8